MGNYSYAAKMLSSGNKWAASVMGSIKTNRKAEAAAAGSESTITITSGWMSLFFDKESYMFDPGRTIIYKLVRIA